MTSTKSRLGLPLFALLVAAFGSVAACAEEEGPPSFDVGGQEALPDDALEELAAYGIEPDEVGPLESDPDVVVDGPPSEMAGEATEDPDPGAQPPYDEADDVVPEPDPIEIATPEPYDAELDDGVEAFDDDDDPASSDVRIAAVKLDDVKAQLKKKKCDRSIYNCQIQLKGDARHIPTYVRTWVNSLHLTSNADRGTILRAFARVPLGGTRAMYDGQGHRRGAVVGYKLGGFKNTTGCNSIDDLVAVARKADDVRKKLTKAKVDANPKIRREYEARLAATACVQPNHGIIKGNKVYAWAAALDGDVRAGAQGKSSSGWVARSELGWVDMGVRRPRPGVRAVKAVYKVKSGSQITPATPDASFKRDVPELDLRRKWAVNKAGIGEVGDYLLRDGGYFNLIFSLPLSGGASTDTFSVDANRLYFARAASNKKYGKYGKAALITKIYEKSANGKPKLGTERHMTFAFGRIADCDLSSPQCKPSFTPRWGWVTLKSLVPSKPASPRSNPPAVPGMCDGKPDGTYCSEQFSLYGYTCRGGALAEALSCPPPMTRCKGPSPDGKSLVCEL